MRWSFLCVPMLAAGLLAGCGGTEPAADAPSVRGIEADERVVPRRTTPRWRGGISDERPTWLRDLPERLERYRAPEDSTRAGLAWRWHAGRWPAVSPAYAAIRS